MRLFGGLSHTEQEKKIELCKGLQHEGLTTILLEKEHTCKSEMMKDI